MANLDSEHGGLEAGRPTARPKVFLSYARKDDDAFVELLRDDLVRSGIDVWWDRKSMMSRGRTFLQELRDAIEASDRLLAVIGPKAVESDYVQSEWEHAILFAKGVIPVLRRGEWDLAPESIRSFDGPDMTAEQDYGAALDKLVKQIKKPVAPLGVFLTSVPALPPGFQPRPDDIAKLNDLVLPDIERPVVVTTQHQTTVIHGMGGIGKSVLASAFARSVHVRRACADGIAWLSIGREPDLLGVLRTLGQALGDDPAAYLGLDVAKARLPRCLEGKRCLIILDDIWEVGHTTPFLNALSRQSRLLITTRDSGLLSGVKSHPIEPMSRRTAFRLLADSSGEPVDELPAAAKQVAEECGYLPFAMALCGAMRQEPNSTPWNEMLEAVREAN